MHTHKNINIFIWAMCYKGNKNKQISCKNEGLIIKIGRVKVCFITHISNHPFNTFILMKGL